MAPKRAVSFVVALAATGILAAGCATADVGVAPAPVPAPGDQGPSARSVGSEEALGPFCGLDIAGPSAPPTVPLPADAVLVSVTRCLYQNQRVPGDGEWLVRVEQKATSGMDALAAALRMPSGKPDPGGACPAVYHAPVIIEVTDTAGRKFHPEVPHDACDAPLATATGAIDALPWQIVATTMHRRVQTELSITSGCEDAWKAEVAIADGVGRPKAAGSAPTKLRVCRYDLDPSDVVSTGDGASAQTGFLVGTSVLDATAGGKFLAAVAAAPQAGPCDQPQAPFAVVKTPGDGPWVNVELGGCHRATVNGESYLRQLDAALVDRLLG